MTGSLSISVMQALKGLEFGESKVNSNFRPVESAFNDYEFEVNGLFLPIKKWLSQSEVILNNRDLLWTEMVNLKQLHHLLTSSVIGDISKHIPKFNHLDKEIGIVINYAEMILWGLLTKDVKHPDFIIDDDNLAPISSIQESLPYGIT